jgi:hypothetical protein
VKRDSYNQEIKIIMIKNKIGLVAMAVGLLFTFACEDEDRLPIVSLDTVEKGAYPRLIEESDKLINLLDIAGSSYTYSVEFVDIEGGELVEEYIVDVVYDDNNPDNGDNSVGPIEFLRISSSEFSKGDSDFPQTGPITISATDVLAATGINAEDIIAGDNFNFQGRIELTDGRVFTNDNSSATVRGPAFRGHFNYTLPAACPSDLTGTYSYTTTAVWCPEWDGSPLTGTVDVEAQGGGVYNFSDWSFGAYGPCYGGIAAQPALTFTDVCEEVSFTGFTDSFGDTWTYVSSIDGDEWTIQWSNTYGESATSVITFPGGVPFTLDD